MLVCLMILQIPISREILARLPHGKAVLFQSAARNDEIHYHRCSANVYGTASASSYFLLETWGLPASVESLIF